MAIGFLRNIGTDLPSTQLLPMKFLHDIEKVASTPHSGKSATIRESDHGSGVCKEHYA